MLVTFVLYELRARDPMMDMHVFRDRVYDAAIYAVFATLFCIYGTLFIITQYFQNVREYSPEKTGFLMLAMTIPTIVLSPLSGRIVAARGARLPTLVGLSTVVIGTGILAASDASQVWVALLGLAFVGAAGGLAVPSATSEAMGSIPPERSGMASGILSSQRALGSTAGFAIMGSILAIVVSTTLPSHLEPIIPNAADRQAVVDQVADDANPQAVASLIGPGKPLPDNVTEDTTCLDAADDAFVDRHPGRDARRLPRRAELVHHRVVPVPSPPARRAGRRGHPRSAAPRRLTVNQWTSPAGSRQRRAPGRAWCRWHECRADERDQSDSAIVLSEGSHVATDTIDPRNVEPVVDQDPNTALSHAEPHSLDGLDSLFGAADLDFGGGLTPKEKEQQLARQTGEAGRRLSSTGSQDLGRPRPLELETDTTESPCQEPRREAGIAPQRFVQCGGVRPWIKTVGSADILMVNEELVEVRDRGAPTRVERTRVAVPTESSSGGRRNRSE